MKITWHYVIVLLFVSTSGVAELQVLTQPPQPTGLSALGATLQKGSEDYARQKREENLLARQRQQQLEDIAAQRAYDDQVRVRQQKAELEEQKHKMALERARQAQAVAEELKLQESTKLNAQLSMQRRQSFYSPLDKGEFLRRLIEQTK